MYKIQEISFESACFILFILSILSEKTPCAP
jgi:hypothetical protein